MTTVSTENELDALPQGTRLRFTASGAVCTKVLGGLWSVTGHKGAYMPSDLVMNGTPMEIID
jgi:hypothetical protein